MPSRHKDNIFMIKKDTPKVVRLPGGRKFVAHYRSNYKSK